MFSGRATKAVLTVLCLNCFFAIVKASGDTGTVASLHNGSSVLLNEPLGSKKQVETKSESATAVATHALRLNDSFLFSENLKSITRKTPASLEIENDSAENFDSTEDEDERKSEFDDLVLTQTKSNSSDSSHLSKNANKNVYKVPRHGKKTMKSPQHMSYNMPQSSRFMSDEQYFQVFASLFDHYKWNIPDLKASLSRSQQCFKDIENYLNQLRLSREWAIKIADASGRYRGMFFFENDYWLGSQQFCNEINNDYEDVALQFFVVKARVNPFPSFNTTIPRIIHVGQCLPQSCTTVNVAENIMNIDSAFKKLNQMRDNAITIIGARAVPGSFNLWHEKKFYFFGSIFAVSVFLVVWATIYESFLESKGFLLQETKKQKSNETQTKRRLKEVETCEMNQMNNNNNEINFDPDDNSLKEDQTLGFMQKALLCFAYRSNARVILSTKKNSKDSLTCIHGLRLFSLLWTVMVHTYLEVFAVGENRFNRKIAERTFIYQIVGNATYSVDTFFFISGLLVVLLFLRTEHEKNKRSSSKEKSDERGFWRQSMSKSFLMIFYRFLRLTPTYFIIIGITELAMKVVYNGSVFTPGLADHVNCEKFWLRNVLYINNFYPLADICMMWSWYLSNDFQFYIVAVLLLILSTRYLKIAVFSSAMLLTFSWIFSIYISIINKYTHKVSDPFESFDILYDKPWQRFGPYAMGMITGYILFRFKNPPKISPLTNFLLWSLSILNLCSIVFGVIDGRLSIFATSLYVSLGHSAWGLSLCWLTLSCCWNMARPVNSFLSYKGFLPLSRLTFSAYLIHPVLMMMISFQFEAPMHLKHGMVITTFFGNSALSFIAAFVISIMFEAPVIRMLKLCFRK